MKREVLSGADPSPPSCFHPVPAGLEGVQRRPHVQVDRGTVVRPGLTPVVVYDISHLTPTPVHNPVMTIKRQFIPDTAHTHTKINPKLNTPP